jgi:hypothetical protein
VLLEDGTDDDSDPWDDTDPWAEPEPWQCGGIYFPGPDRPPTPGPPPGPVFPGPRGRTAARRIPHVGAAAPPAEQSDPNARFRIHAGILYRSAFAPPDGPPAASAPIGGFSAPATEAIRASRHTHIQEKWLATGCVERHATRDPEWRYIRAVWAKPKLKTRMGKEIWDSRICPNGSMIPREESGPTCAPTCPATIVNSILALCAYASCDIHILDVSGAFYASDRELYQPHRPVCFEIPKESPDYNPETPNAVWLITRAVPGLREAPLAWHDSLTARFAAHMEPTLDPCVWRFDGGMVVVHVDDICVIMARGQPPTAVLQALSEYQITEQHSDPTTGALNAKYLGLRLFRRAYGQPMHVHLAPTFIEALQKQARAVREEINTWQNGAAVTTLLTTKQEKVYLSLLGKLGWATSKVTPWRRPFYASAARTHLTRADYTTLALWMESEGTTWPPITFPAAPAKSKPIIPWSKQPGQDGIANAYPRLETYADVSSSAEHCLIGLVHLLRWSGGPHSAYSIIGWSSRAPQRCVSSNSGELEAILTAANIGRHTMEILLDLGILPGVPPPARALLDPCIVYADTATRKLLDPCVVYTDNLGASQIVTGSASVAVKHGWIVNTIQWVRHVIKEDELIVHYVPRAENPADALTKSNNEAAWITGLAPLSGHADPMSLFIAKKNGSLIGRRPINGNCCSRLDGGCTGPECRCWAYSNGRNITPLNQAMSRPESRSQKRPDSEPRGSKAPQASGQEPRGRQPPQAPQGIAPRGRQPPQASNNPKTPWSKSPMRTIPQGSQVSRSPAPPPSHRYLPKRGTREEEEEEEEERWRWKRP